MSSPDRMPEAASSSDDSGIVTGRLTPISGQSDGQSTSNLLPHESSIPLIEELGISPTQDPTPVEPSASIEAGRNSNEEPRISPTENLTPVEPSASIEVRRNSLEETNLAQQQQETIYDAEGDIVLIVGQSQSHKFQLTSKLLGSTSTKWRDLIASSKVAGSGTIHLPDDDFKSVTILLQIVHLRFSALPRSITFQELYSLARLSQKYQVRELLQPFVSRWTVPFIREELDLEQTEWILISHEFSIDGIFEPWIEHLARSAEKDENGRLMYRDHSLAKLLPESPRDYLRQIEDARSFILSKLVEVCQKGFEETCCHYRGESPFEEQCNMLMRGYLLTGLLSLGGWPLDSSTIRTSAKEFKTNLMSLHFRTLPGRLRRDGLSKIEDHYDCGFVVLVHQFAAVGLPTTMRVFATVGDDQSRDDATSIRPILLRMGFRSRDFDIADSDSESDDSYDEGTDSNSEPDEEFEVDQLDEESNEDFEVEQLDNESSEESEDNDGGQGNSARP